MKRKAAIYHFTNESKQRPKIYRDQLEALREYAESVGLDVADIYCDMSLKRSERTEFDRFLANSNQYDVLVTKDFYHIEKNTGKCLGVMQWSFDILRGEEYKKRNSPDIRTSTPEDGDYISSSKVIRPER